MYLKKIGMTILAFLLLWNANGQVSDDIMSGYADEYGIYTKYVQHLTLYFEKGELKAKMDVERERMLIDELYAGSMSTESVYHSYFGELKHLEAATLVPNGKGFKVIKTAQIKVKPSKSESVFYDDATESEISFSHLQKGNRTNVKYTIQYRDAHMLPRFYLQSYLPYHHLEFKVTFPNGLKLNEYLQGGAAPWLKKTVQVGKKTSTIVWEANKVPKSKFYADAPRMPYYVPHLIVLVGQYQNAANQTVDYLNSTSNLNSYLFNYLKNVDQKPGDALTKRVTELTNGLSNDAQKVKAIYKWVQDNIRYIAFEDSLGGFVPREAALVYKRKFGDCKDMSSLLKVMCEQAGVEARYVWIGTRNLPYSVKEIPMPGAFDHMICAAKVEGKWVFLDGTDNSIPYGAIPYAIQGKEAFINKGPDDFEIITILRTSSNYGVFGDSSILKIEGQKIVGKVFFDLKGYPAWEIREMLKYKSEKEKEEAFHDITKRGNNKYVQKDFQYNFDKDDQKSFHVVADFEINDYIKNVSGNYYVNMHLNKPFADSKIEMDKRKAPVNYNFNHTIQYTVALEVPKGYKVAYMPKDVQQSFKDVGSCSVKYVVVNNHVVMHKVLKIDNFLIQSDQFAQFNKLIDQLQQVYKESIELTKEN